MAGLFGAATVWHLFLAGRITHCRPEQRAELLREQGRCQLQWSAKTLWQIGLDHKALRQRKPWLSVLSFLRIPVRPFPVLR